MLLRTPMIENLETRTLYTTTPVSFGDGVARSVSFLDENGIAVVVTLKNGQGTLNFDGTGVTQTSAGKRIIVEGTGLRISSLDVTNAANAVVSISGRGGNGSVNLGDVTVDGTLATFAAKTTNLGGDFVAADAGNLVFGAITNGSITDNGTALPLKIIVLGAADNADVNAAGAITVLKAGSWTDTDSSITGLSISKLQVSGDFESDLDLTAGGLAMASAKIGHITGGSWNIDGNGGKIQAIGTAGAWNAIFTGTVNSLRAIELSGDFTADSISQIKAVTLNDAHVTLSRAFDDSTALNSLTAASITDSSVRANSNLGSIRSGSVTASIFTAGVGVADEVDAIADFTHQAEIRSFRSGAFNNSAVIAEHVAAALLGAVDDGSPTLPFYGVAAEHIDSLRLLANGKAANLQDLTSSSDVAALLADQGITLTNFEANLPSALSNGNGGGQNLSEDTDRLARIADDLSQIEQLQQTAVGFSYEGSALAGSDWQPDQYFYTYHSVFDLYKDAVDTKNDIQNEQLKAGAESTITPVRDDITTHLRHEAVAIPLAAQEDGWRADYEVLANEIELYPVPF